MSRMDSRRARRKMKQMGMDMNEISDVKRVIIQGEKREIVIEGPQVTSINVQGIKMYQVAGGKEAERKPQAAATPEAEPEKVELVIPEEDILLVAQQANVSIDRARVALEDSEGDLAQAIIKLQTR